MKAVSAIDPGSIEMEDIVDDTVLIEDDGEDHTDSDGVCDIR